MYEAHDPTNTKNDLRKYVTRPSVPNADETLLLTAHKEVINEMETECWLRVNVQLPKSVCILHLYKNICQHQSGIMRNARRFSSLRINQSILVAKRLFWMYMQKSWIILGRNLFKDIVRKREIDCSSTIALTRLRNPGTTFHIGCNKISLRSWLGFFGSWI